MEDLSPLLAQLEACGCPVHPAQIQRAAVALEELFTNSVFHGQPQDPGTPSIGLGVAEEDGTLHIHFEDGGPAFDPFKDLDEAAYEAGLPVEQRAVGGVGRLIVEGLSDGMSYAREQGRNCIGLRFWPKPADIAPTSPKLSN